jgi:site-specific recombinase XerD
VAARLHALRHSLLTLLATEGVNLAALREMAGHKRISTTFKRVRTRYP